MTTTAAAWRHALESLVVTWCMAPGNAAGHCGCTAPTPDPASPCGFEGCEDRMHEPHPGRWDEAGVLVFCKDVICHPHRPTLCTCGHAIQEAR